MTWLPYDKWKKTVKRYMWMICEQNDLPTGDWPDIPDLRHTGASPVDAAYQLLEEAGRLVPDK